MKRRDNNKTRQSWLKKLWIPIVLIVLVGFPILINWVLQIKNPIEQISVIGEPKDWLSFWGVYLGAAATFFMVIITFKTLGQNNELIKQNNTQIKQNNDQLDELKRQWEEEHRPRINLSIIIYRKAFYIKIKNIGRGNANDIKLSFNNDYVENLPKDEYKVMYKNIENKPFVIAEGEAKYIFIGFCDDIRNKWSNKNVVLEITGTYSTKYNIDEKFYLEEFITQRFMAVKDALWEIADGLSCPNSEHYPIQQSLDIIAKQKTTP